MEQALTLYDYPGLPCARRVRIVLLEKGLRWSTRLDWVSRVYDGTAVSEHEAAMLGTQLCQRLDRLERALAGADFLVGAA